VTTEKDKRADGGANIKTKHLNIKDDSYSRPVELAHGPAKADEIADIKAQLDRMEDKLNQLILRSGLR
jgi:hypothetical protein